MSTHTKVIIGTNNRCQTTTKHCKTIWILAHLSRRLVGGLLVYPWSGVRPSSSTISNMTISATNGPITLKINQKHCWDGKKAALCFGPDRIRTLVSMATKPPIGYNRENGVSTFSRLFFIRIFSYLQVMITCMRAQSTFNFGPHGPLTAWLAAPERLKNTHRLIMRKKQTMSLFFSAVLDRILFILSGYDNIHESLDKFEIQPDPTTGFYGNRYGLLIHSYLT